MNQEKEILSLGRKRTRPANPKARILRYGSWSKNEGITDPFSYLLILKAYKTFRNRTCNELFETIQETNLLLNVNIQNKNQWEEYPGTLLYQNISQDGIEL